MPYNMRTLAFFPQSGSMSNGALSRGCMLQWSYTGVWMQFVPSREAFFAALGTPGEQMMLDLQTLFDSFEPLLLDIQKFLVEHNLDFQVKV